MSTKPFLALVAESLLTRYGHDMRHVTVVFPSRRASTFLFQELSVLSNRPIWVPRCLTIGELFASLSPYKEADKLTSVCQLYEEYVRHVGPQIVAEEGSEALQSETLDRFWGWGEVMLSDMDDIDKHLADARAIFTLVKQTEELSSLDYLTEEQRDALQRFLGYTLDRGTLIKRRFMRLWEQMVPIYEGLNARQMEQGERYQGALYRDVCQRLSSDEVCDLSERWPHIAFVGFNALNDVELQLMKTFKRATDALFYWDYDVFYTKLTSSEAGLFMRQNLANFGCALSEMHFDNLSHLKDVELIACSTDNAQARYVDTWLQNVRAQSGKIVTQKDAVVLCNEHLLMPTMHAIPQDVPTNITMGFPLCDTPIYSFVHNLLQLQIDGYDLSRRQFRPTYVELMRRHAYTSILSEEDWLTYEAESQVELLQYLQCNVHKVTVVLAADAVEHQHTMKLSDALKQLYIEAAYQISRVLQQFLAVVQREDTPIPLSLYTLRRLMRQVFAGVSIPFHGDQTKGLQLMGVLETRCLDFRHLLMLAVEEDCLPRGVHELTLIPPHIREAFSLTTARHKVAIYSYYFYRLIQRSERLTCLYNDNTVGIRRHEISRFLRQLQAETDVPIRYHRLVAEPNIVPKHTIDAPFTERVRQKLLSRYAHNPKDGQGKNLSPTAINRYLKCPLQFYFRDVAQIYEQDECKDGVDASLMGLIFHDTAEAIYKDIMQRSGTDLIEPSTLTVLLADKERRLLRRYLDIVFDAHYFHPISDEHERLQLISQRVADEYRPNIEYKGEDIIVRDVLLSYLSFLIRHDARRAPFRMLNMEDVVSCTLGIQTSDGEVEIVTGGRVDRLDEKDGTVRIVDYKTGSSQQKVKCVDDMFKRGHDHPSYIMQTMLYAMALNKKFEGRQPLHCALLYPAQANQANYNPELYLDKKLMGDVRTLLPEFEAKLKDVLTEIFTSEAFAPTDDQRVCKYCDFASLCGFTK